MDKIDKSNQVIYIFSLGKGQKELLEKALVGEMIKDKNLKFYLIWSGGEKDLEITNYLVKKLGIDKNNVKDFNIFTPFSLEEYLKITREVKEEVIKEKPFKVIVNFSGGDFLLSTALFYVTFEEIWENEEGKTPELKVYYTYKTKEEYKNEECSEFIYKDIADYVLGALKNCDYSRAKMLAEELPDEGEFGFLKNATYKLFHWNNFNYEDFYKEWNKKIEKYVCETLKRKYPKIVDTLDRLYKIKLGEMIDKLKKIQREEIPIEKIDKKLSFEEAKLVVVDILENIRRRIKNSEYLEAVLLSYRAVEAAIQIKLIFHHQVNPWRQEYTFKSGFDKLNELEEDKYKELEDYCKTLANLRNSSFLEHGFFSPDKKHAEKAIECAENIILKLLDLKKEELENLKKEVSHMIDE